MTRNDYFQHAKVLVPVDLSKSGWKNLKPFELLSSVDVVLLGLYQITDQVSPEQARDEFGEEAKESLRTLCDRFEDFDVVVESKLMFSVDLTEAIDRVANEEGCNAILTWNEKTVFRDIGVYLRAGEPSTHLLDSVASLMLDKDQTIALIHYFEEDDESLEEERKTVLENKKDYLVDRGLNENQIEIVIEQVEDIDQAMVDSVSDFDAVVMGETEPSVASKIFGTRHEKVQANSDGPVLIVRRSQ